MNADTVLAAIKQAVGDPSCGPIKDAWGDIDRAVRRAMKGDEKPGNTPPTFLGGDPLGDTPPAKETRIIRAQETPEG